MNFKMSKLTWGLIIAMLVLNVVVLTGTATGIVPDALRMIVSISAIISIGVDWRRSSLG